VRTCIIGTSHIAALKLAEKNAAAAGLQCTFFGAPALAFAKVHVADGIIKGDESIREHLLRTSEGHYESINPAEFDAIVFHGIDLQPSSMIYSIARRNPGARILFSQDFLFEGVSQWFKRTRTFSLARQLVGRSGTRIILSPVPCPAAPPSEDDKVSLTHLKALRPQIHDILAQVCAQNGMSFLRQPEETYDDEAYYTKREYSTGSVRLVDLNRPHPEDDFTHMNAQYGALVMGRLATLLGSKPISSPGMPLAASA